MMDHHRHTYCAEEGADTGSAGAGTPAASDAGQQAAADAATDTAAAGLPTAEQWAQVQETLAALKAEKATAAEEAEARRVAELTASEKAAEEQAALRADLEAQQAALRADRRDIALDKLKVLPNYRAYVPDVDPRTEDGAAKLEAWAKAHPEALQQTAAVQPDYIPRAQSKLADIAAGKASNPLVPLASLRKIMGGN